MPDPPNMVFRKLKMSLMTFGAKRPFNILIVFIIALAIFLGIIVCIIEYIWPIIQGIWNWGKSPWYFIIPAGFIDLCIVLLICGVLFYSILALLGIIGWYGEIDFDRSQENLRTAFGVEQKAEQKTAGPSLTATTSIQNKNLNQIIEDSQFRLYNYYSIGFAQARKSFRFGVVAMFIGFIILLLGIADTFGFFSIFIPSLKPVDINTIVIAGSLISEVIAGLFLWVYKFSIQQLNYFYGCQNNMYNFLIAYTISDSMGDATKDTTKSEVVKTIMELSKLTPHDMELPHFDSLKNLVK
jgi:hypothetical protein